MFKNTSKLLISNFSTVWKLLLYKIFVVAITIGLFCVTLGFLKNIASFSVVLESFSNFFLNFNFATAPVDIIQNMLNVFSNLFICLMDILTQTPIIFAYLILLFFFIFPYLWHLSDLAVSESLLGFMTSQTKYSFFSSLVRNLRKENAYSWSYTLVILPFNVGIFFAIYKILTLANLSSIWAYLVPSLILIVVILYFSLRIAILSPWASVISGTNTKTWASLRKSINKVDKNFFNIWSNAIVFVFLFSLLCLLTSIIGCVILLPLFSFVVSILGMVVLFEIQGMRYYVDFSTIVSPKKLEQTDKIKKLKNII